MGLWAAVLGLDRVGVHDDFLALGGDSPRAMQIARRVSDLWPVEIPLRALLETPTPADMAARVTQRLAENQAGSAP